MIDKEKTILPVSKKTITIAIILVIKFNFLAVIFLILYTNIPMRTRQITNTMIWVIENIPQGS